MFGEEEKAIGIAAEEDGEDGEGGAVGKGGAAEKEEAMGRPEGLS